jgi:hypothetical protein
MAQVFAVYRENGRALSAILEAVLGVAADVESRRDPEPQTGALVRAEKADERFHGDQEDGLRREIWHRTCVRLRYRNSRRCNGGRRFPVLPATASLEPKAPPAAPEPPEDPPGRLPGLPLFPPWPFACRCGLDRHRGRIPGFRQARVPSCRVQQLRRRRAAKTDGGCSANSVLGVCLSIRPGSKVGRTDRAFLRAA